MDDTPILLQSEKPLGACEKYFISGQARLQLTERTPGRRKLTDSPKMQVSVSVILCTHNPRHDYLCRVLASLREQTLPAEQWEFLVVDNRSNQRLAEIWDISWHPRGRHIREDELGLTAARLRGIQESSGSLLVFVDDDNVLAPDFLDQAKAISGGILYWAPLGRAFWNRSSRFSRQRNFVLTWVCSH
jgi:glycosyltransferase involved in cell wall biosynthesis